jgi:eukaryotic-like serine/threonine-protein kinase
VPARSPIERARASDPASTVAGDEEARAFYQERLSTFGRWLFILSSVAWSSLAVTHVVAPGRDEARAHDPFSLGGTLHLVGAIIPGLLWLFTRRGRLAPSSLQRLDVAASIAIITLFAGSGAMLADPQIGVYVALLSFNTVMLTRAIVVPSTARRTLFIGLVTGSAVVALGVWHASPNGTTMQALVVSACWSSVGIAIGSVASHTIFGLRREASQARVLGQYRLEAKIGEGGMGEVWRASHALLRRPTAVKLLPPDRMGEEAIRRFELEVQLTARLTHPGTVAIYDYGRTRDGIFYYAMELLDGTDLESLVRRDGPQPPGRVIHVLTQVCGALAEAHDLGLVHRDVKPANILLSPRSGEHEFAKILDFGLVKSIDAGDEGSGITAAGSITGTPLYMSPESIRAPASVDSQSDLYGLGAVAWFLLVGRPPFDGHNILDVCSKHLQSPPPRPSAALGRPLPADVEEVVLACLEKSPDARPPGARALRGARAARTARALQRRRQLERRRRSRLVASAPARRARRRTPARPHHRARRHPARPRTGGRDGARGGARLTRGGSHHLWITSR